MAWIAEGLEIGWVVSTALSCIDDVVTYQVFRVKDLAAMLTSV